MNERLVLDHVHIVEWQARFWSRRIPRSARSVLDESELRAIGLVCLCEIVGKYEPARGDFAHYAGVAVRGAILEAFRRITHARRADGPIEAPISLDRHVGLGGHEDAQATLVDELESRERLDDVVEAHELLDQVRALPPRQRQVTLLKLVGLPEQEIGERLGIATGTVSQSVHSARTKLRAAA